MKRNLVDTNIDGDSHRFGRRVVDSAIELTTSIDEFVQLPRPGVFSRLRDRGGETV